MAIVAVAVNRAPHTSTVGLTKFFIRATSANVSAAGEELVAAPAAGSRINITRLRLSCAVAGAFWLADEDDTILTQTYYFAATGGDSYIEVDFSATPRIVADGNALEIRASGAAQVSVEVEGLIST